MCTAALCTVVCQICILSVESSHLMEQMTLSMTHDMMTNSMIDSRGFDASHITSAFTSDNIFA